MKCVIIDHEDMMAEINLLVDKVWTIDYFDSQIDYLNELIEYAKTLKDSLFANLLIVCVENTRLILMGKGYD